MAVIGSVSSSKRWMGCVAFVGIRRGNGVFIAENAKSRPVLNYFRSLHGKQNRAYMSIVLILKGVSAAAAAVGSGVETCGKTMAPSVFRYVYFNLFMLC